jgi:PPOX class probable F420-dependent enzyme
MADDTPITNYEDVSVYDLDPQREEELIAQQNECTFGWVTRDGSPMAAIMSYLRTDDGVFWMTASEQRKRIAAIRRDPRVVLTITSPGTAMGPGKTVTYKGTATVHHDPATKQWFYPALAERLMGPRGPARVSEFAHMLDSPRRVIVAVTPTLRVGYDGDKMGRATAQARKAGVLSWDD